MSDRDTRFSEENQQSVIPTPTQPVAPTPVQQDSTHFSMREKYHSAMERVHQMHLFSAFCENPANVSFQTQEDDERVLLFLRKSQIMNIPWILGSITLALLPLLIFFFHDFFVQVLPPLPFLIVITAFYYLLVISYAFINFITWYYNVALITSKRVVDIDFHQLVFKDIAETKLALVQDVSYQQVGTIQNLFGFGHVLIQTAGTLDNFEFFQMPQPSRIVEVVEGLIGGKRFYEP